VASLGVVTAMPRPYSSIAATTSRSRRRRSDLGV
jgi:hypothetical protein